MWSLIDTVSVLSVYLLIADPGGSTFTFEMNNSDIECFEFNSVPWLWNDQCTGSYYLCTVVNKI